MTNVPAATDQVDERFMRLALRQAERGAGCTSPNPAVGAVIVRRGRVVGRGYHRAAGQPHAEIEALRSLADARQASGATLYVTLEPCSTHGRTPPCTAAILAAGLTRVVIGATDPNPQHAGRGGEILRAGGLEVRVGVLAEECHRLNRAFNRWIVTGRPWVIAKVALTLDGRLTRPPGEDRWLSGAAARAHAHRQRARVDAILVGAATLRSDNPRLTVRDVAEADPGRQPWRVVLTRSGNLPPTAHVFTDAWRDRTLVMRDQALETVLHDLGARQITSVLIEGGGQVLGQAFAAGLVDEVQFYLTPRLAGGPGLAVAADNHAFGTSAITSEFRCERLDQDVFIGGLVGRSAE